MISAGSFSGHLVDSYMAAQFPRGPFGQPLNIAAHGPMSFAPQMHGSCNSGANTGAFNSQSSFFSDTSFAEMSEESARKIATLQAKLDKKLGPEYISQRPGPGGGPKLTYAEGWKIINLANEVFGFNGWSSSVINITTDFIDYNEESRRFNVGITAIVRVTLRDGVFHEDVGYGLLENSKSKGAALDKCKKEAVTDAVKRTLRNFGNLLGNCLYDKAYTQEVIKIKVPPPKLDRSELHRRPEFEGPKPDVSSLRQASTSTSTVLNTPISTLSPSVPIVKPEPASMPMQPPPIPQPIAASSPDVKGKAPQATHGLRTPMQTSTGQAQAQVRQQSRGGMAERTAERHAARLKAIQDAQAQWREDQAAAAAAASHTGSEPLPQTAASSAATSESILTSAAPQVNLKSTTTAEILIDDEYDFPSEDDALFATLDLEGLDEGIGRPIDFEEGKEHTTEDAPLRDVGGSHVEAMLANAQGIQPSPQLLAQPLQQQQRNTMVTPIAPNTSKSSAATRSQMSHSNQHAMQNQSTTTARQGHSGPSSSGERPRTPSMGGGFNFPAGQANTRSHPYPQPHRGAGQNSSGTTSSSMHLKRTADIMQGLSAARRPQQGMGLANPPNANGQGTGAGGGAKREPFAALEIGEGGDVKRVRRQ